MIESIRKITNPLTIIAIFAGLAEVSGTIVLPLLSPESQQVYVWFLMVFPILLIIIFFATLNWNYQVLYAPSDFQDENNFLKLFGKPSPEDKLNKINAEITEIAQLQAEDIPNLAPIVNAPEEFIDNQTNNTELPINETTIKKTTARDTASFFKLVEDLVITKISQEFEYFEKDGMLRSHGSGYLFDAVASKGGKPYVIEVKYLEGQSSLKSILSSVNAINEILREISFESNRQPTVLLVIATNLTGLEFSKFQTKISNEFKLHNIRFELRFFSLSELERELVA